MTTSNFFMFIPFLPPGINQQYMPSYTTGRPVLTKKAREWKEKAALVVAARSGVLDWEHDAKNYRMEILIGGARSDVDAYSKTIIDVVTSNLGFDDRLLVGVTLEKCRFRKLLDRYVYEETRRIGNNEHAINEFWRGLDGINSGIYVKIIKEN